MSSWNRFAPVLVGCLAVGMLGGAPEASAASAGQSVLKPGNGVENNVVEIKSRNRGGQFIYTPIAPSYRYYDYPYYYSRGHYPTHIKPGFIYYGYPYSYYKNRYYRKYGVRLRGK
jgi:hypothetical protein